MKLDDGISTTFIHSKLLDFSSATASRMLKVQLNAVLGNVADVKYLDAGWQGDVMD